MMQSRLFMYKIIRHLSEEADGPSFLRSNVEFPQLEMILGTRSSAGLGSQTKHNISDLKIILCDILLTK